MHMTDREMQIGICGTFDLENYGDILFPLVAEAELSRRLKSFRLHRFSYFRKTQPDWLYDVNSLADLPDAAGRLDGMLVGGGHLIRFDKHVAAGYTPPAETIHHPTGYWLTPALICLQQGLPVIWNAPGVHGEIPNWAEPLMHLAINHSNYVAVRDEPARQALLRFADESKIVVVPDTAFGVAHLLDLEQPSSDFIRLRETIGLKGQYIVVQATDGLEAFTRLVKKYPKLFQDYQLVVLQIGPVLGDSDINFDSKFPKVIRLPAWPHPLLIAELIGHASAVIGISLHLTITALSFGVPVFRPAGKFDGKYSVLSSFDTVMPFDSKTGIDPKWFASKLGRAKLSPSVRATINRLSDHWDHIADTFATAERRPATPEAFGHFWESLPNLLEEQAAIADKYNAAIEERDKKIIEMKKLLATAGIRADDQDEPSNVILRKIKSSVQSLGRKLR